MPRIVFERITKRWGSTTAVNDLDLTIPDGSFTCLLGPSGCGKTTSLRMLAGLEEPTEGRIIMDDTVVFDARRGLSLPPDKRNLGMIFQNYALWPHMTVFQNIVFALEAGRQKLSRADMKARVTETASWLKIDHLLERYPAELSGGQQQRVAMARSLAPQPGCLLLDEPLSNLDAKLRIEMRAELKRIHAEIGMTAVFVTHDQLEAITLATHVAVMSEGELQQLDEPLTLYAYPDTLFVAEFVGNPPINLIPGKVWARGASLEVRSQGDVVVGELALRAGLAPLADGRQVVLGIRPEDVGVHLEIGDATAAFTVRSTLPTGPETFAQLERGDVHLFARLAEPMPIPIDTRVAVRFRPGRILVFDHASGKRIGVVTERDDASVGSDMRARA